jgi:SulP family sulfate permease
MAAIHADRARPAVDSPLESTIFGPGDDGMTEERGRSGASETGTWRPSQGLLDYALRPVHIFRTYRRPDLVPDLIAGITVAAVAIPQAIAYASIAELPPQYGLYTAVVAAIVGSLWGSSRHLATGPVNAVSLLALPILLSVAEPGTALFLVAASTLALMVGLLDLLLAVLRFGALVTLASRSVLLGFTAGAAIHIVVGQLKHLLRVDAPAEPELVHNLRAIVSEINDTHVPSLLIGLGTLALLLLLRRVGPRMPAALGAISVAGIAVYALGLVDAGVQVVGSIPRSPPPFTWTTLGMGPDLGTIRALVVGSLAVAALGLVEAVASGQTIARRSGDRLDSNQEFFGQGLANLAAGMFSGYPCSGSFTRSSLAHQAGARTQLAGVITGTTILAAMLVLAPYATYIPRASIAAVLFVVAWGMIDREGTRRAIRTSRSESAVMAITFGATLTLPLDFAVLAGVLFSLAFFVIRSSLPRVYPVVPDETFRHLVRRPDAPVCPQLGIMNIRGPLFFGAVYHIEDELRHNLEENPGQNLLILRMHGVDICDLSGIEMLESTVNTYRSFGGDVFLVRPRQPVLEVMEQSGFLTETLGSDHVLSQEGAIDVLFDRALDPLVCVFACQHRLFAECQAIEKHPTSDHLPVHPHRSVDPDRFLEPELFSALLGGEDTLLLDVREPEEYDRGHLAGAQLMPLRVVVDDSEARLPRDRTLLVVCRSGRRTARAMQILHDREFESVYGLRGGILAWRAAGLPLVIK